MRLFSRTMLRVLALGAALLAGLSFSGCDPGPIIWQAGGGAGPVSPIPTLPEEAVQ